jgi:CRISPR-associated RAMP protein (TIGR02581 family)
MSEQLSRGHLRARYIFTGKLVLETALHIGGGRDQPGASDSPVIRDPLGRPFVPGSSFKGAFRAAVERLLPNLAHLGLRTCALARELPDCLTAQEQTLGTDYRTVSSAIGRTLRESDAEVVAALGRLNERLPIGTNISDIVLLRMLNRWLCDTCKVFGSPFLAATAHFTDLPVVEPWYDLIQVRDGVGIDRDSERARDRIKYDFEAVPPGTAFAFKLMLENPGPHDLGLVAIGLQEFVNGMVPLGGIRSRGLGRCRLEGLQVQTIDFTDGQALRNYLTGHPPTEQDAGPVLVSAVERLLNGQED